MTTTNAPPTAGSLRRELTSHGLPLSALTVLSAQRDPYRVDTPAGHRDAAWFRDLVDRVRPTGTIHLRAVHYAAIGGTLPNGTPYANTDENWTWLSEQAAKAARWLGYVGFDRITDARNAAPVIRLAENIPPGGHVFAGLDVALPDPADILPTVESDGFVPRQNYRFAFYGEKSSLEMVLGPLAEEYGADLYLPTGEISDTMMHTMAAAAAADGRPLQVFTVSDCDPAGWQMPISIARKLQALRTLLFPDLEFEVHRVGLLPEHVAEYGLPSTPLKSTERRADAWTKAKGVAQTEVDALLAIDPDALAGIVRSAVDPYFDHGLAARTADAERAWLSMAQAAVDAAMGPELRARLHAEAEHRLAAVQAQLDELNRAAPGVDLAELGVPDPVLPTAQVDHATQPAPLVSSAWDFPTQCDALKSDRAYAE